jgi:CubicO group peptidase (beta-lactamase class C family)
MRPDTQFRLASLSKTMVSAAALALVEQGRLAVTDPVAHWLPDFTPKTRDGQVQVLTIHHLLTHTAGPVLWLLRAGGWPLPRGRRLRRPRSVRT